MKGKNSADSRVFYYYFTDISVVSNFSLIAISTCDTEKTEQEEEHVDEVKIE